MEDLFDIPPEPKPIIAEPSPEPSPKPEPVKVKKKRKPLSDERKKQLREQLAKGRATSLAKRQARAKSNKITKAKKTLNELVPEKEEPKVEPKENIKMEIKKVKEKTPDTQQLILNKLIALEQRMNKSTQLQEKKKEVVIEKSKPIPITAKQIQKEVLTYQNAFKSRRRRW